MTAKKLEGDYHALANNRGFEWLGPMPPHTHAKTSWECLKDHQWEATYQHIRRGKGCPQCARINQRHSQSDYYALAKRRGYYWLGPETSEARTKTGWKCERGHRWEASYDTLNKGRGCPFCAGNAPKTTYDFYALAERRSLEWLGSIAPNNRTKTLWRDSEGREWWASYDTINHGSGCPNGPTSIELAVAAALDICGIAHQSQYRPDGYRRIYDEFVSPNILIEAQGDYWHGPKNPGNQKNDIEKAAWAEENGYHLIVIWEREIKEQGAWTLVHERILPLLETRQ